MMLIAALLSCPAVTFQNTSGLKWNDYDYSILNQAKRRCGELYPDAPCVKLFRKYNFQQYSVICGAKKEAGDSK